MKLTIIPDDGAVYYDNVSYRDLDLFGVPTDVHALQWQETSGWIEFRDSLTQNAPITELPQWALNLIPLWDAAKLLEESIRDKAASQPQPISTGTQTL